MALGDDGLIEGMRRGAALFDLSTNSLAVMRKSHAAFAEKSLTCSTRRSAAARRAPRRGKLAIWVGGDQRLFNRHQALLDAMGDQPLYRPDRRRHGRQARAQLHELRRPRRRWPRSSRMGVKAGVEPARVVGGGAPGRDRPAAHLRPARATSSCRAATTRPTSRSLVHKDVSLAIELGREVGVPMRLANLALDELTEALNRGWGDKDSSSYMLLEAERAGVEFSVPPEKLREVLDSDPR